jgi:hypothetical protein
MALMKYTAHVLVAGWLLAVCATGQASAANVKLVNFYNNQVAIAFEGDIVVGDFERFGQVGEQALALGKPAAGIWLNSGGGDFGEAAKFADKLFSLREAVADKPGAAAVVGFEQTCASACFLIFACTQHRIAMRAPISGSTPHAIQITTRRTSIHMLRIQRWHELPSSVECRAI